MKPFRHAALAALVCLTACQREAAPEPAAAGTDVAASGPAEGSQAPVQEPLPPALSTAPPPLNPVTAAAPADDFAGWYYEKNGQAMLLACGQSMPLQVSDPAFLRQLRAKRGGADAPIYVQLAVRPSTDAKLEVAEIRLFGVDEGPAPQCAPMAAP